MKERHRITGFYLETLLLIVVFIAIILVLTQVFGLGKRQSSQAELLTNAVCLAQNAAEAVSASDSPEAVAALLNRGENARVVSGYVQAGYSRDMTPESGDAPALLVRIGWEPTAGDEQMIHSTIQVFHSGQQEPLYTLETAVFLGEVGA